MGNENHVIGSKNKDNKQAGNKEKISSVSTEGKIAGNQKPSQIRTQNSANHTPGGPDEKGDAGIKVQEKRQKKIITKNALYNDKAIKAGMQSRGMM